MKLTALLSIGLTCLLNTTANPLPPHKIDDVNRISLPGQVIFHSADGQDNGGGGTIGSPAFSNVSISENITACCGVVYDNPSPVRTQIIRDDCLDLARRVQGDAGFYELTRWSAGEPGQYHALVNSGTCEFGIQRLDGVVGWNQSTNDVAVIGNQDIFHVLNASVFDFAGEDEYYMDAMRINGHMNCRFWVSVNASMEFLIQYTGSGDR